MNEANGEAVARYRPDIDGLRAIAVTAVILFHAHLFPFASGYVGVDIFFVISGYLIGGIILREVRSGRFSFAMFYARRARRILPALFTVVLTTCLAGWFLLSPLQFRGVGATATSALLGVSNISFFRFRDYFGPDARLHPLLMTWSLGVEEQFYLLFPFLVFAIGRWARGRTLAVLVVTSLLSFIASTWCTYTHPAAAFYLLPFRAWELGVGVILASTELTRGTGQGTTPLLPSGKIRQILGFSGLALLAVAIFAFNEATPFPGFVAVLPVFGTAALISARSSWVNRAVLSSRPMVLIGTVSYSWYLWHWPLMSYVRNVAFDEPAPPVMIITAAVSFCLAVMSWRFVEQPFRQGRIRVRPVLSGYAAALTVALAFPLAIKLGQGFPGHVSPATGHIEAVLQESTNGPCLAEWDDGKPNLSSACVAKRPGRPTVVIIGDSHAAALSEGVRKMAARQDWGYMIFAKILCRPLIGVTDWRREAPRQAATCSSFMDAAFAQASAEPSVATVILAGAWPRAQGEVSTDSERFVAVGPYSGSTATQDLFHYGLERAVAFLVTAGKQVVILGDVPRWRFDVMQVALSKASPLRSRLAPWLWSLAPRDFPDRPGLDFVYQRSAENISFFNDLSRNGSVRFIDLFGRFCGNRTCVYERDGKPLFVDSGHLSTSGAFYALQDVHL